MSQPATHDAGYRHLPNYSGWTQERCGCAASGQVYEMHSFGNAETAATRIAEAAGATVDGVPLKAAHVLGFAAEKYGISKHMRDYAAIPVIIMPSDLPNRNKVGFPFRRLTEFDTHTGHLGYQTWRYMPTHSEHANEDPTQAKGIVLDVGLRPLISRQPGLWKVNALLAFDRQRDAHLVNRILRKELSSYSMGAYVGHYSCSICGAETANKQRPTCDHIPPNNPRYDVFTVDGQRRLAHWNTGPFKGFEVSAVGTPAYQSAVNPEVLWGGEDG